MPLCELCSLGFGRNSKWACYATCCGSFSGSCQCTQGRELKRTQLPLLILHKHFRAWPSTVQTLPLLDSRAHMPTQLEQSAQDGLLLCATPHSPAGRARVTSEDSTGRRWLQDSPLRHTGFSFLLFPGSVPLPHFYTFLLGIPWCLFHLNELKQLQVMVVGGKGGLKSQQRQKLREWLLFRISQSLVFREVSE